MTYKEFLTELEKTPRDWSYNGVIRRVDKEKGCQCPISSLKEARSWEASVVAEDLGLSPNTTRRVVHAADGYDLENPIIRKVQQDLLKACGLNPLKQLYP